MAVQKTITSSTGLEVQDAYIKIDEYSCIGRDVNIRIRAYVSKELADNGASFIEGSEEILQLSVDYSDDAPNAKKQIYQHLKTIDRYADSIDILE